MRQKTIATIGVFAVLIKDLSFEASVAAGTSQPLLLPVFVFYLSPSR